jgi:hypothetical protein
MIMINLTTRANSRRWALLRARLGAAARQRNQLSCAGRASRTPGVVRAVRRHRSVRCLGTCHPTVVPPYRGAANSTKNFVFWELSVINRINNLATT